MSKQGGKAPGKTGEPNEPKMPAGGWGSLKEVSTILLKEARAVRFNNFVAPGKSLHVECSVHKRDERTYTFKASGTVDGASTISARITLEQFNLAERNPELRASDERRVQKLRQLFDCLWRPALA